jgi:hypothetical protein
MYLFGHFDLDAASCDPYSGLNEAILGIREAARSTRSGASHTHSVNHAAALTEANRSFMFGMEPAQPQAMPWEEQLRTAFCFWAA